MRHLTYFILITLLMIGSCAKEKQSPPPELIGNWQWKFSSTFDHNIIETPENTGIEKLLVLTEDFGWTRFENGISVGAGTFSVGHGENSVSIYTTWIYDSIVFHKPGEKKITDWEYYEVEADTLTFAGMFAGIIPGIPTVYVR